MVVVGDFFRSSLAGAVAATHSWKVRHLARPAVQAPAQRRDHALYESNRSIYWAELRKPT